jgi:hypothetical protein
MIKNGYVVTRLRSSTLIKNDFSEQRQEFRNFEIRVVECEGEEDDGSFQQLLRRQIVVLRQPQHALHGLRQRRQQRQPFWISRRCHKNATAQVRVNKTAPKDNAKKSVCTLPLDGHIISCLCISHSRRDVLQMIF